MQQRQRRRESQIFTVVPAACYNRSPLRPLSLHPQNPHFLPVSQKTPEALRPGKKTARCELRTTTYDTQIPGANHVYTVGQNRPKALVSFMLMRCTIPVLCAGREQELINMLPGRLRLPRALRIGSKPYRYPLIEPSRSQSSQ